MIGPVVGGYLIWLFAGHGVPMALACAVALRGMSLIGVLLLPTRRPDRVQPSVSLEAVVAGIRFVWRHKPILATISLDLFAVLLGGATFVLPAFADQVLGYHSQEKMAAVAGYLRSAEAAGAILMAVLLARSAADPPRRLDDALGGGRVRRGDGLPGDFPMARGSAVVDVCPRSTGQCSALSCGTR